MNQDNINKRFKLLLVGVGGQGVLTAARILGEASLLAGTDVMVGQLHGMSQRGGSVECSVLIGHGYSSFIGNGQSDVVLGVEPLEVLRALPKMSEKTKVIVNLGRIVPFSMVSQGMVYPDMNSITKKIKDKVPSVYEIDGLNLIKEIGVPRSLNILMLGVLAGLDVLPFSKDILKKAIEKRSPMRFLEPNHKAFELGVETILSLTS